jgi:hypothetical protein
VYKYSAHGGIGRHIVYVGRRTTTVTLLKQVGVWIGNQKSQPARYGG